MKNRILYALLLLLIFSGCAKKQVVDLILHNGKVYTVDDKFGTAEAFAVKDGKIIAMGTTSYIMGTYKADSVIDAKGNAVYPGFIDAHAHFVGYGKGLFEVNLTDCKTWEEGVNRAKDFETNHRGQGWIIGRGWDQNKWPEHNFPDNRVLTSLFPNTPVLLVRIDGHAAVANAKALTLAGIQPGFKIEGGEAEAKDGKLTGLLIDNAVDYLKKVIPGAGKSEYESWLSTAQTNCFAQGLTTITDCGLSFKEVAIIDTLQREGKLQMRLYVMLSDDPENFSHFLSKGPYKTDRLFVNGVKAYADGALGSRGACLLAPYTDKAGWGGFLLSHTSHFDSLAQLLLPTGFQMCTHAIGDSGVRMVLGVYNKYLNGKNDRRWRIEHAQVVNPADFSLFGKASIIPSVQPTHATSDMTWALERLGPERLKGAYASKQLLEQNGWIALGTDFPVEDISPFKTFYAAVIRKDATGQPATGFQTENALTREQTLRGMTIWAAKAGFLEKEVGSLEAGKKADFIILDKDLLTTPETEILNAKVLATYIGGQNVFGGME